MPIQIVRQETLSGTVKIEMLVNVIEANRERVRTVGNMIITTSGILIPVCLAFLLFFIDKGVKNLWVILPTMSAILLFLVASSLGIVSGFLHGQFPVISESLFVETLITLLNREFRISRWSFVMLILGIISMITGVALFAIEFWR